MLIIGKNFVKLWITQKTMYSVLYTSVGGHKQDYIITTEYKNKILMKKIIDKLHANKEIK